MGPAMKQEASMRRLRITIEGKSYDVTVEELSGEGAPALPAPPSGAGPAAEPVVAQVAGAVVSVAVKEGQAVAAQAPLLVIEAMKMQATIAAPRGGTVTAISVKPGDAIEEGQILMMLA